MKESNDHPMPLLVHINLFHNSTVFPNENHFIINKVHMKYNLNIYLVPLVPFVCFTTVTYGFTWNIFTKLWNYFGSARGWFE